MEPFARMSSIAGGILTRRALLRSAATATAVGMFGGLLAACGGDDDDDETPASGVSNPTPTAAAPTATPTTSAGAPTATTATGDATPTAAGEELGQPGGELIYGLSSDPPNMDPHIATGAAAETVKMQIYSGLLRFWIGGEIQPELAEQYEISEDGLTYTFTLRQGVKWHDGSDFSGADVKASFERIKNEETGASFRAQLSPISEVDDTTDGVITLTLSQTSAPLLTYLAHPNTSILQKAFLDGGGDPNTTSIGTGPFKLDSREPGVRISLVKNEEYFIEGRPMLDKLTFIPYADENTRMAAIRGGEIHMADYVPWKDMDAFESDAKFKLYTGNAAAFMTLIYNTTQPPFDNPAVRVALGYAIDRQAVIDIVFFGRGTPITGGLVPPDNWAHNAALEGTYSYDPEKAIALLQEAGVDPSTLSVRLLSTSQYLMHQGTGEVVQANLRDIGIDCELELYDWPTTVDKGNKGEFQFRIHGLGMGYGDPDFMYEFFHSGTPYTKVTGFSDAEIDRMLEEGRAELDQAKRKEIYDPLQERIIEVGHFSFISYRVQGEVSADFVKGFHHFPGGLFTNSHKTLEQVTVN